MKETAYMMFSNYPDLLTVTELQNALGIGRNTAYTLIKTGHIKSIRIGKQIRVRKTDLISFISQDSIECARIA